MDSFAVVDKSAFEDSVSVTNKEVKVASTNNLIGLVALTDPWSGYDKNSFVYAHTTTYYDVMRCDRGGSSGGIQPHYRFTKVTGAWDILTSSVSLSNAYINGSHQSTFTFTSSCQKGLNTVYGNKINIGIPGDGQVYTLNLNPPYYYGNDDLGAFNVTQMHVKITRGTTSYDFDLYNYLG